MSSGWFLLKNVADWDTYRHQRCVEWGLPAGEVQWGQGPRTYPCLVTSYRLPSASKVLGCYTYLDDAVLLLRAAGLTQSDPGEERSRAQQIIEKHINEMLADIPDAGLAAALPAAAPGVVALGPEVQAAIQAAVRGVLAEALVKVQTALDSISVLHESYREFFRYSSANTLTVADILVNRFKGYVTPADYENGFVRFLAFVDQHGADKAREKLLEARAILTGIRPDA